MKKLLACCSLFLSTFALGQAVPYPAGTTDNFWIEGRTITLAYSSASAPAGVTNTLALQMLGQIEARLEGLNIAGLTVNVDTNVRTACGAPGADTVLVCWGPVPGNTSTFETDIRGSGVSYWQEAKLILDTQTSWTSNAVYMNMMHQLMHVLGFGHPDGSGTSVLNGAGDLTQIDIDGLRSHYATRCVLPYTESQEIRVPFVTYQGNAYDVTIRHTGTTTFTLVGSSIRMYGTGNLPMTPCQSIAVDGTNRVHLPYVNVGGAIYWGDLGLASGNTLTLITHARR